MGLSSVWPSSWLARSVIPSQFRVASNLFSKITASIVTMPIPQRQTLIWRDLPGPSSMSRMPNLQAIDLSNNKITMTKKKNARSKNTTLVSSLIMGLKTRKRSLKRLNFSSNRISGAVAEAILASNNGIEDFNLSKNNLGDPDGVALARGVAAAEHLKALRLRENKISLSSVD